MKILFVIESLRMGGAEKSLINLLHYLENKHNITVLVLNKGGILEKKLPRNISLIFYKPINLNLRSRIIFKTKKILFPKIHPAQFFRKHALSKLNPYNNKFDIAIAYNQGLATYFVSKKTSAKKKFAWINVDYEKAGYSIKKDIKYYRSFNKIITVSQAVANNFKQQLNQVNEKMDTLVINDIINYDEIITNSNKFTPSFSSNGKINITTVSRLAKAKGIELALKSAISLKKKGIDFEWHIIGDGPLKNKLLHKIRKLNAENFFKLHGQKENPYPYIKYCNIYVQPSIFEGLGLTVIEAKILNKPIICTSFKTSNLLIKDNETGLICDINPISITNSIEKLILNNKLNRKFIDNLKKDNVNLNIDTYKKLDILFRN